MDEKTMDEKMRILAVDDNAVNLATIEQELQEVYEVIPVNSGRRALKLICQEKVDLILLDIQMPVMDGIETLKQIREQDNGITVPVIMLTAKHDKATVIEGAKLGIMDYIVKPFDGEDLRQRIERALKWRGAIPMTLNELYERLEEIEKCLQNENYKLATTKTDEMMGFALEAEVAKRLQAARVKMKNEDFMSAERIITRILRMLDMRTAERLGNDLPPITPGELNAKLLFILYDLEHFQIDDADEKLEELLQYGIPAAVREKCVNAQNSLKEYDDGEAERLIRDALRGI